MSYSGHVWYNPFQMLAEILNRTEYIMSTVQELTDKVETYIADVNAKLATLRGSITTLTEQLQAGGVPPAVQANLDKVSSDLDTAEQALNDSPAPVQAPASSADPAPAVVPVQTDPASSVVPADPAATPADPAATPSRTDPAASLSDVPTGAQG